MLHSFRNAKFDQLTALWNETAPEKYAIDPEILRSNTVDCPTFDWGTSLIDVDDDGKTAGYTIIKHPSHKLYRGPDPDEAHLSAIVFTDAMRALDMLKSSKAILRQRGIQTVAFGRDCKHFFPGCPTDYPILRDFLTIEGFLETGEQVDLTRDISNYEPPSGVGLLGSEGNLSVRPLGPTDVRNLHHFLQTTFNGRWLYDTSSKVEAEGDPSLVNGLFVDGLLKGFAVLQDSSHRHPQCGAIWRNYLGNNWCTLGPIGICPSVRGRGLGDALLATSLNRLRLGGGKNCLIDWTGLIDWYRKHGFEVTNRYKSLTLRLAF
jgi:ribosomal protein S18 acetylase RimI-like enzyme